MSLAHAQKNIAAPLHCRNILVIEDDPDIRDSMQQVLELEGYNVSCASNGSEALERLKETRAPCLILLDLMMPIMNGWQFLEAKRGDIALAPIPVVVVSAAGDRAKATAADGFVRKPVDLSILLALVKQYCG